MNLEDLEEAYNFFIDRNMYMRWDDLIWWLKMTPAERQKMIEQIPPPPVKQPKKRRWGIL